MKINKDRNAAYTSINRMLIFIFILSLFFVIAQWIPVNKQKESPFFKDGARPLVIAHRGGAGLAPENTMLSFKIAEKLGVDAVELDVRMTSDGHLVVIHDETIDRTTNGTGYVSDFTLDEIQKFDAGYHSELESGGYPFRNMGVRIPTLEEVFQQVNTGFFIELKDPNRKIEKKVAKLIKKYKLKNRVIVGSFNDDSLKRFADTTDGKVPIGTGVKTLRFYIFMHKFHLDRLFPLNRSAVQIPVRAAGIDLATDRLVKTIRERNIAVHYWTINDEKTMKELIDMDVDGIITDYPDKLLKILNNTTKEI